MEIKYIKSAGRVLIRDCVNKKGLDLSKNVLWVSVDQGAADLRAVKVGGKKNSAEWPSAGEAGRTGPISRIFLTSNFDSL